LVPDEFYLSAGRVLSDGRIVVSLLTAVNGVVSTKMLIFDPIEATPMLPATGAEMYAWPATGVLLMGIALVLVVSRRRFRVR
jgi:LPXTG-motif cell wall-anchored protein